MRVNANAVLRSWTLLAAMLLQIQISLFERETLLLGSILTPWSTQLEKVMLLVDVLPCFPAQSPPASDSKTLSCGRPKSLTQAFNKPLDNAKAIHDTY